MYVNLEIVRKAMEKHKRSIFYLYDSQGGLIHACEDCGSVEAAFAELEEYIEGCSGNYVIVELPKDAKGKGTRGGNKVTAEEAKFTYKVKLNNGTVRGAEVTGGGSMGIILQLMKENRDIMVAMQQEKNERALEELRREVKEAKSDKDNGIEGFAKFCMKEYNEAKRVKGIASQMGAPAPEPVASEPRKLHPDSKKVAEAVSKLKEVDDNYLENLAFMADYAKEHPTIYHTLISNLKNPQQ